MYYDPMECGMRISKLRMECGKTQQQMADKLNISLIITGRWKTEDAVVRSTC